MHPVGHGHKILNSQIIQTPDFVYNRLEYTRVLWRSLVFEGLSPDKILTIPYLV